MLEQYIFAFFQPPALAVDQHGPKSSPIKPNANGHSMPTYSPPTVDESYFRFLDLYLAYFLPQKPADEETDRMEPVSTPRRTPMAQLNPRTPQGLLI
jgi:hypothetical protein